MPTSDSRMPPRAVPMAPVAPPRAPVQPSNQQLAELISEMQGLRADLASRVPKKKRKSLFAELADTFGALGFILLTGVLAFIGYACLQYSPLAAGIYAFFLAALIVAELDGIRAALLRRERD